MIPAEYMGCLLSQSTVDTLMMTLTPAQSWTRCKTLEPPVRPTFLTHDIDSAFNCVIHDPLTEILHHFGLPRHLVGILDSFQRERTIAFRFDGKNEAPQDFRGGQHMACPYPRFCS